MLCATSPAEMGDGARRQAPPDPPTPSPCQGSPRRAMPGPGTPSPAVPRPAQPSVGMPRHGATSLWPTAGGVGEEAPRPTCTLKLNTPALADRRSAPVTFHHAPCALSENRRSRNRSQARIRRGRRAPKIGPPPGWVVVGTPPTGAAASRRGLHRLARAAASRQRRRRLAAPRRASRGKRRFVSASVASLVHCNPAELRGAHEAEPPGSTIVGGSA
jgi:hypothetical protein